MPRRWARAEEGFGREWANYRNVAGTRLRVAGGGCSELGSQGKWKGLRLPARVGEALSALRVRRAERPAGILRSLARCSAEESPYPRGASARSRPRGWCPRHAAA